MTEIDISTGRPRVQWDDASAVYERHRGRYRDREGTVVRVMVVARGGITAWGYVHGRGTLLECEIGSDRFAQTLDPATGESWLLESPEDQKAKYRAVRVAPLESMPGLPDASDEQQDDEDPLVAARRRYEERRRAREYGGIEQSWREQAALQEQPLELYNAERRIPKAGS